MIIIIGLKGLQRISDHKLKLTLAVYQGDTQCLTL